MGKSNYKFKVIFIGLIFITFGGLLLASNLGFLSINLKEYIFTWQTLLIVIGLISLTKREGMPFGAILILVGAFFHLRNFINFPVNFHQVFWPALIILFGLLLIFSRLLFRPRLFSGRLESGEGDYTDDYIDDVAIFGGIERTITSQNFKGGKSISLFGGSKINMMNTKLAPGTQQIEVVAFFGGSQYLIPKDWNVKINVVSIFGGFADKRIVNENDIDPSRQLIIKGVVIFGGGEIKGY